MDDGAADPPPSAEPSDAPVELQGTIAPIEVKPEPEVTAGLLPLQEDTSGPGRAVSRVARRSPSREPSSNMVTVEARFGTGSRIRRNDRVVATGRGARDEAIGRSLTYNSRITSNLPNATAFGAMQPRASFKDITWEMVDGKIQVDATLFGTFDWGVTSSKINIVGGNSSVVTAQNYAEIAADLTPSLQGKSWRAPRRRYWSEALTARHETYHATDTDAWFSAQGPGIARAYLARNPIALTDAERTDARKVKAKVTNALTNSIGEIYTKYTSWFQADLGAGGYLNYPGEERAFLDGKVPYQQLADGVRAQGESLRAVATPPPTVPVPSGTEAAATPVGST